MPLRSEQEMDEIRSKFEETMFDATPGEIQATQAKFLLRLVLLLEDIHDLLRESGVKKGE